MGRGELQPLKENDLVYVSLWSSINAGVYRDVEMCMGKDMRGKFLYQSLLIYPNSDIFKKFLRKYGRLMIRGISATGANMYYKDKYWKIEFGILMAAYRCFEGDPRELERIMKVAKTKGKLKIHLGVS